VIFCLYFLASPKFSTASQYTVRCGNFAAWLRKVRGAGRLKAAIDRPFVGVVVGNGEGNAAATGAFGLGIAELEAAAHQIFGVVDRQSLELGGARWIDQDGDLGDCQLLVFRLHLRDELQIVGQSGTAIGPDGNAKVGAGCGLSALEAFDFDDRPIGKLDHWGWWVAKARSESPNPNHKGLRDITAQPFGW
jgi:hypothetical protein